MIHVIWNIKFYAFRYLPDIVGIKLSYLNNVNIHKTTGSVIKIRTKYELINYCLVAIWQMIYIAQWVTKNERKQ